MAHDVRGHGGDAQQVIKISRIGFLGSISASKYASQVEALLAGLHDLGYIDGKNVTIEFRWAEGMIGSPG